MDTNHKTTVWPAGAACLTLLALAPCGYAVDLSNGLTRGTDVGAVLADVQDGGEVSTYNLTGQRADDNQIVETNVLFDYFPVVRAGTNGFELSSTTTSNAALSGDAVVSSGVFTGANGNPINWTSSTTVASGSTLLSTTYNFTAQSGTLGDLSLFQYLDEDVFSVSDDIFFERGSLANENLQLFTIDGASGLGVAQSGAFSPAGGLSNASYTGYVADEYNQLQGGLADGSRGVSLSGLIDTTSLPAGTSPLVSGTVYGPEDVVSALGWQADANATSASIVATLGGVPDLSEIPDEEPPAPTPPAPTPPTAVPSPSAALGGLALLGGMMARRRRHTC